jgi:hypothetical protein
MAGHPHTILGPQGKLKLTAAQNFDMGLHFQHYVCNSVKTFGNVQILLWRFRSK